VLEVVKNWNMQIEESFHQLAEFEMNIAEKQMMNNASARSLITEEYLNPNLSPSLRSSDKSR
jgi:hypothetical protein